LSKWAESHRRVTDVGRPFISTQSYAKINRVVMRILFWIPLLLIALYEATLDPRKNSFTRAWFEANEEEDDDNAEYQDPEVEDEDGKISKTKFAELIKDFPNTSQVCAESSTLR
jgi:hypothetical protein